MFESITCSDDVHICGVLFTVLCLLYTNYCSECTRTCIVVLSQISHEYDLLSLCRNRGCAAAGLAVAGDVAAAVAGRRGGRHLSVRQDLWRSVGLQPCIYEWRTASWLVFLAVFCCNQRWDYPVLCLAPCISGCADILLLFFREIFARNFLYTYLLVYRLNLTAILGKLQL